jgi:hypothetical protein
VVETSSSIQTAVFQALTAHKQKPFDALVVIRGGGSVTDLAWLNDMELARLLCQSPVPIFTGIGHERDNTILDEIAHTRFDTSFKVALQVNQGKLPRCDRSVGGDQRPGRSDHLSGTDDAGESGKFRGMVSTSSLSPDQAAEEGKDLDDKNIKEADISCVTCVSMSPMTGRTHATL